MKFLVIQTAFIGDAILATAVLEKLHTRYPDAQIDFMVRKGNESLFAGHPFVHELLVWDKKNGKYSNLLKLVKKVRGVKYDYVINLHRFASSGIITAFSGSKNRTGFSKNPFSFLFTKKVKHVIGDGRHETERNHELIKDITDPAPAKPRLYPSEKDYATVMQYRGQVASPPLNYVCIAPASVWFTKQLPKEKWIGLIHHMSRPSLHIYLLGAPSDKPLCDEIAAACPGRSVVNLAGRLSLLESAALIKNASMNYVNDSAPLHIASAMNAPVTAFFCSTVPAFGFGPLSQKSFIAETREKLACRPCGLHGFKECPQKNFRCALSIDVKAWSLEGERSKG